MKLIQDIAEYRLVMEFLHKIKDGKKRVIIAIDGRAGKRENDVRQKGTGSFRLQRISYG